MTITHKKAKARLKLFQGAALLFLQLTRSLSAENKELRQQLTQAYDESDELTALLAKEYGLTD